MCGPRAASLPPRSSSHAHGRDHVLPALVAPHASIPVLGGEMALGTWQSVCLVDTNGDNEVWNLAKEAQHYKGITTVMHLRENLRQYVAEINDVAAATGMPMMRPMFLQWPDDKGCQGKDVEDQFM